MREPTAGGSDEAPAISPTLLALLVCPLDRARLELVSAMLVCTSCRRRYPIESGIPNMLVERSE